MITSDDSRGTYEYGDWYVIYPNFTWWNKEKHFTSGGKLIKEGWEYNSETNNVWLGEEELRKRIIALNIEF
ncbi:MAG: hypothetical protein ACRC6B_06865 [Fusobacteriaceae bacterium]